MSEEAEVSEVTMEASCWFECGSHDALMAVREWWDAEWATTSTVPEPERTKMICHWAQSPDDADLNPWEAAWRNGLDQASMFVENCPVEGVHLYAIHVQPVDAEYPATTQEAYTPEATA